MTQTVRIGDVSFEVHPGEQADFWTRVDTGRWEPRTYHIFDEFISAETLFLDIGAWIGSTVLYAAQKAQRAVAFEPDPIAFSTLKANLEANSVNPWVERVEIVNKAVNADGADLVLGNRRDGGDSMSSVLFEESSTRWTVKGAAIAEVIENYSQPNQPVFLKIDIEGGEYSLIPAMRDILADPRVTAVVSMHPGFLRESYRAAYGNAWKAAFREAHRELIAALPRNRNVCFGRMRSKSRLGAILRANLTGSFTKQILVS